MAWPSPPILLGVGSAIVLFNNPIFFSASAAGDRGRHLGGGFKFPRATVPRPAAKSPSSVCCFHWDLAVSSPAKTVYGTYRNHTDEDQIVAKVRQLGDLVKAGNYDDAYSLFDDPLQKKQFPKPVFEATWRHVSQSPIFGSLQSIDWNHLLFFDVDPVDDAPHRQRNDADEKPPRLSPTESTWDFEISMGVWLIDQVPTLFSTDTPGAPQLPKKPTFIGPAETSLKTLAAPRRVTPRREARDR